TGFVPTASIEFVRGDGRGCSCSCARLVPRGAFGLAAPWASRRRAWCQSCSPSWARSDAPARCTAPPTGAGRAPDRAGTARQRVEHGVDDPRARPLDTEIVPLHFKLLPSSAKQSDKIVGVSEVGYVIERHDNDRATVSELVRHNCMGMTARRP